jgi:hypothetical protein
MAGKEPDSPLGACVFTDAGGRMDIRNLIRAAAIAIALIAVQPSEGQTMPGTAGETLSGKRIVLADATRGQAAVLVAGFSHEGGSGTGAWVKAVRADQALAGVSVFQVAMLEGAPSFMRGAIKSGMRKGTTAAEQDQFVVLTQDEKLWRQYFSVATDKEPYVVFIDAKGNVVWHGHGPADQLEPLLKTALH